MTSDEARARELADLLHTAYEAELEHEHGIEHMTALLLPLIRDQGRYLRARQLVDEQAEDEALWCMADSIVEAYVQQELRRLHAAIEDAAIDKAREGA